MKDAMKLPRKGSGAWVRVMVYDGGVLTAHRSSPVLPWRFDIVLSDADIVRTEPVTEVTIRRLVESGDLYARAVAGKCGCYDTISYTLTEKGTKAVQA